MLPGDIVNVMMGDEYIEDPEAQSVLVSAFGINEPIYIQ